MTYCFKENINQLVDYCPNFDSIFISNYGQYPSLLSKVLSEEITLETLIILDKFVPFLEMWNKKIEDDVVFTIGLTPNRTDAMSLIGVARDLYAAIKQDNSLAKTILYVLQDSLTPKNGHKSLPSAFPQIPILRNSRGLLLS